MRIDWCILNTSNSSDKSYLALGCEQYSTLRVCVTCSVEVPLVIVSILKMYPVESLFYGLQISKKENDLVNMWAIFTFSVT